MECDPQEKTPQKFSQKEEQQIIEMFFCIAVTTKTAHMQRYMYMLRSGFYRPAFRQPKSQLPNLLNPRMRVFYKYELEKLASIINYSGFTNPKVIDILELLIRNEYHADLIHLISRLNVVDVCAHTNFDDFDQNFSSRLLELLKETKQSIKKKMGACKKKPGGERQWDYVLAKQQSQAFGEMEKPFNALFKAVEYEMGLDIFHKLASMNKTRYIQAWRDEKESDSNPPDFNNPQTCILYPMFLEDLARTINDSGFTNARVMKILKALSDHEYYADLAYLILQLDVDSINTNHGSIANVFSSELLEKIEEHLKQPDNQKKLDSEHSQGCVCTKECYAFMEKKQSLEELFRGKSCKISLQCS